MIEHLKCVVVFVVFVEIGFAFVLRVQTNMLKPLENTHDLVQSDFRTIQKLVQAKNGKLYSVDYIRKVCKGNRKNDVIREMAEQYLIVLKELKLKVEKLTKD